MLPPLRGYFPVVVLVAADPESPARVFDPVSQEVYVLVPEKTYASTLQRIGIEQNEVDIGLLVTQAMAEYDEDDPLLDSYQEMRG